MVILDDRMTAWGAIEPSRVASPSVYHGPYLSVAVLVGEAQLGGQQPLGSSHRPTFRAINGHRGDT